MDNLKDGDPRALLVGVYSFAKERSNLANDACFTLTSRNWGLKLQNFTSFEFKSKQPIFVL